MNWIALWLVLSVLGLLLGVVIVVFVMTRLPHFLQYERKYHPPGTNYAPVRVASTEHVDLMQRPFPQIDGLTLFAGDRVLLKQQQDGRENGLWMVPLDGKWQRTADLMYAAQCLDGAMVFVTHGDTHKHETFVLRVLSKRSVPGEADLFFLPILQHLFGPAHLPEHQVLQVNGRGLATWNTPDLVAQQTLAVMKDMGWETKQQTHLIPRKLHFLYGLWDQTEGMPEEWTSNMNQWIELNPSYQMRVWTDERCSELIRSEFVDLWPWYQQAKPAMRVDLLKWLILYHEGGFYLDLDTHPCTVEGFDTLVRAWHNPRMVLVTESQISVHEAESLNRFEIRKADKCEPGPRLGIFFLGAVQRHPFTHFLRQHMLTYGEQVSDAEYDVTFATGSDALSTVFRRYGKDFVDIHVLSQADSEAMVKHNQSGTWRTRTK